MGDVPKAEEEKMKRYEATDDGHEMGFVEIAQKLNISKTLVHRDYHSGIEKLRQAGLLGYLLPPSAFVDEK